MICLKHPTICITKYYKAAVLALYRLNPKKIALVINTGGGNSEAQLSDAVALRRATLANKVPYCTNMSTAKVCLEGIKSLKLKDFNVISLQDI